MKLYDLAAFRKRREAEKAARAAASTIAHGNEPGAASVLKQRVLAWLKLRTPGSRDVL